MIDYTLAEYVEAMTLQVSLDPLTPFNRETLRLAAVGLTIPEIAKMFSTSNQSIRWSLGRAREKLASPTNASARYSALITQEFYLTGSVSTWRGFDDKYIAPRDISLIKMVAVGLDSHYMAG